MSCDTWKEIAFRDLPFPFTQKLKDDWMLVSAGSQKKAAAMTISWGGTGYIWNKHVVFIVIRESRNTLSYLSEYPTFSLTLFDESYHDKLLYCGRNSGRDTDKIADCGFTLRYDPTDWTPYFEEAHTAFICRRLYSDLIEKDGFLDGPDSPIWEEWYNTGAHTGDRHHLIIASIEKVLRKGAV